MKAKNINSFMDGELVAMINNIEAVSEVDLIELENPKMRKVNLKDEFTGEGSFKSDVTDKMIEGMSHAIFRAARALVEIMNRNIGKKAHDIKQIMFKPLEREDRYKKHLRRVRNRQKLYKKRKALGRN